MGKKDRERFEQTGKVFRGGVMVSISEANRISDADRERIHQRGYNALQALNTSNQIKVLRDSLHLGKLSPGKLRKALEDNAHKEMQKGADKLRKKGKPVTVDTLLEEYHKDRDFQELATEVGLNEEWFIALANKECTK